jgi:hypothetical protein
MHVRGVIVLLIFVGLALPVSASKLVTVAQLEQTMTALSARSDSEIAQRLAGLELTERLSSAILARLEAHSPGSKTSQELDLLASRAAFLALPTAEIPSQQPPSQAKQRALLALVAQYATKTVHDLPNFLAIRETNSYADTPKGRLNGHLYLAVRTSAQVVYRDGSEVDSTSLEGKWKSGDVANRPLRGLVSSGEFGPILKYVVTDAAWSELQWGHWESSANGPLAVFRYVVSPEKSHYGVGLAAGSRSFPGYHGEFAVDPSTGAVLRLTTIADPPSDKSLVAASTAVEYGSVDIGGKNYTCPLRSVSIVQTRDSGKKGWEPLKNSHLVTMLNEVEFQKYQIFRTEVHLMPDAEETSADAPATGQPATAGQVQQR